MPNLTIPEVHREAIDRINTDNNDFSNIYDANNLG